MQYERYFYNIKTVDFVKEFDFLDNSLTKLTEYITRDLSYFNVTSKYNHRFDLISYEVYQIPDLYWIISLYNGIINPFQDITGRTFEIPHIRDVYDFISENSIPVED